MTRRLLSGLALLLLLAEGALPSLLAAHAAVAVRAGTPTETEDWPCRHHDCGCKTQEQCLTDCCCFKPRRCCHEASAPEPQPGAAFWNHLACRGVTGTDFGSGLRPFLPPASPSMAPPGTDIRAHGSGSPAAAPAPSAAPFHPPRPSAA